MSHFTDSIPTQEGDIESFIPTLGKVCKTHYWVYGSLKSGVRPLVALHGGPGFSHNYLLPLLNLTKLYRIPVILYDQLGIGHSTALPETKGDVEFWTIQLFIDELVHLLKTLKVENDFDLFGHSAFATTQPKGLKKLIICSGIANMRDFMEVTRYIKTILPLNVQGAIDKYDSEGFVESSEYKAAADEFYQRFVCRMNPWPAELVESFAASERDDTVYTTMFGRNEFTVIGPLKDFNIVDDLHKVKATTLLTNGEFDEIRDNVMRPFFLHISRVKWVQFPGCSHVPFLEDPDQYLDIIGRFLSEGY
ncbi:Alpha/Beta hydrolase protein [Abortiporus biennis]|nr:Alpha/Beta hydrolase protein [Abortiporus biennis]